MNVVYYFVVVAALGNVIYIKLMANESFKSFLQTEENGNDSLEELQEAANGSEPMQTISSARQHPLIMVAGHPRSGTTLMRSMLDAHEHVHCGEETHIVPLIVESWNLDLAPTEYLRQLSQVGLTREVMERAVANFLLVIISRLGAATQRLCNKDPFTMAHATFLRRLFPNAKFIFMVRDGRAAVHSLISRNVTITHFDLTSYENSLRQWDKNVNDMYQQCEELGPTACLPVHYELLILRPRQVMKSVLKFLNLPWREEVLRHHEFIAKDGGVSLNPMEPSTTQVKRARYEDALTSWVGHLPQHLLPEIDTLAPMLSVLGYDPKANPPSYEELTYTWGHRRLHTSPARHPIRRFFSAVYHRTDKEAAWFTKGLY